MCTYLGMHIALRTKTTTKYTRSVLIATGVGYNTRLRIGHLNKSQSTKQLKKYANMRILLTPTAKSIFNNSWVMII